MSTHISMTDFFCGAGGSSTGAIQVPGVSVRAAANHWQLAVETHNENHPDADHYCADLSQIHPKYFPKTTFGWFSPECTNHSQAKGIKRIDAQPDLFGESLPDEAAERSRATMWDVVRFSEYHRYEVVFVENVVEAAKWAPFHAWLAAMDSLGYDHRLVMLNSMHAQLGGLGAPQSRDRLYVMFWRRANRAPDFERVVRPRVVCPDCGPVNAMQVFKKPGNTVGRYRQQYAYRCPNVKCRNQIIEPSVRVADEIIDWTLLGTRLGDREKPLADKTMARICAGIDRYWAPFIVERRHDYRVRGLDEPLSTVTANETTKALAIPVEGREGKQAQPVSEPMRTITTRNETGLAFMAELRGGSSDVRALSEPLSTVTASGFHHGLVTTYYGKGTTRPAGEPLSTVTAVERHALLMRNNTPRGNPAQMVTPVSEPMRTLTTEGHQSLLSAERPTFNLDDVRFRMLEPRELKRAMDFPADYVIKGNRREQVRMAGNAVTPPSSRDLITVGVESLS
ncbi:DNA methyltransferase [Mycobacteroides sp. H001]|uniref:DNA cytosine methyltransferase n=1 Tax=unclassified Mycobacteroides TaxID=2618759 RepID=UPI0007122E33|nr:MULTISPECIES: DNA cytosine methyltransferase [unclassified Mycobacteroides]KRQ29775.1 DNA methyltransferase [Mycobacteroides sp. H002]KRQ29894.1 DNA methyltransferase [Mycobacteroides sp. H072]KRQ48354.1 DNA methyltransferase [Mycobacteroides sp. H054]KRQ65145.1 DNA methyltransferase [Mycobacteroides sp. H001]